MSSPPMRVGVDGSEPSLLAVDRSADEALLHASPLRLVDARRHGRTAPGPGDADVDSPALRFACADARLRGCELYVVRARRLPHPAVSVRRSASEGATP